MVPVVGPRKVRTVVRDGWWASRGSDQWGIDEARLVFVTMHGLAPCCVSDCIGVIRIASRSDLLTEARMCKTKEVLSGHRLHKRRWSD